eukprot:5069830-Pleurochrysis_carterae.AAC.1
MHHAHLVPNKSTPLEFSRRHESICAQYSKHTRMPWNQEGGEWPTQDCVSRYFLKRAASQRLSEAMRRRSSIPSAPENCKLILRHNRARGICTPVATTRSQRSTGRSEHSVPTSAHASSVELEDQPAVGRVSR